MGLAFFISWVVRRLRKRWREGKTVTGFLGRMGCGFLKRRRRRRVGSRDATSRVRYEDGDGEAETDNDNAETRPLLG